MYIKDLYNKYIIQELERYMNDILTCTESTLKFLPKGSENTWSAGYHEGCKDTAKTVLNYIKERRKIYDRIK